MLAAVFATFVGLAAAQSDCASCSAPSYSKCVDNCLSHQYNLSACTAQAGCIWQDNAFPLGCSIGDPNITEACAESTSLTGCEALPNCTWQTTYCKRTHYCQSNNGTICDYMETCSDQGPHCYDVFFDCREASDRCEASTNQAACTATSGCFWAEMAVLWGNNNVYKFAQCRTCFQPGSENNTFSQTQKLVGYSCYINGNLVNYTSATAANTGCSGGQTQAWEGAICFQAPTTSTPSAPTPTPTTLAPSSGCTKAPTDSTVSGAVARGAVGLMAGTLLGTFLLA